MKCVTASMLVLAVIPLVVDAKRRRVPFMVCPSTRSNSGLVTVHSAQSKIECSVICLNDPDCLSASYCKNPDGYTCQLSSFYADGTCTGLLVDGDCTQTAMLYPCENGGTFFSEIRTCHCVEGFVGDYCQRRYRDGSKDGCKFASAAVIESRTVSSRIPGSISIYPAEAKALIYIKHQNKNVIISDSSSCLQGVGKPCRTENNSAPIFLTYHGVSTRTVLCCSGSKLQRPVIKGWYTPAKITPKAVTICQIKDCSETPLSKTNYTIQPLGSTNLFEWRCGFTNYTDVVAFMFTHVHNYKLTQHQAKEGIPIFAGYFFLGLENLHQLTKQGRYDIYVAAASVDKAKGLVIYTNFRVDSEANGYALHWDSFKRSSKYVGSDQILDGFGGNGDVTKNLNGSRFGTYDNDISGCARAYNASWWYNPLGCTALMFDLNGLYWPTNRSGTVEMELLQVTVMYTKPVYWYIEDDLFL